MKGGWLVWSKAEDGLGEDGGGFVKERWGRNGSLERGPRSEGASKAAAPGEEDEGFRFLPPTLPRVCGPEQETTALAARQHDTAHARDHEKHDLTVGYTCSVFG